ncbi:MAG: (2Fe-2S)-binding protein, partial [Acidimicrobiales bacterium]
MTETLHRIEITVNGELRALEVPARRLLSDALRGDLNLTGTHVGCEHGVCGCCTVLLDGEPVRSCLIFAVAVQGREIRTVEGLASPDGGLSPVQQAFSSCHGLQCGFCTPGFLVTTTALLQRDPAPSPEAVTEALAGNLCRCTGYQNIRAAVAEAVRLSDRSGEADEPTDSAEG